MRVKITEYWQQQQPQKIKMAAAGRAVTLVSAWSRSDWWSQGICSQGALAKVQFDRCFLSHLILNSASSKSSSTCTTTDFLSFLFTNLLVFLFNKNCLLIIKDFLQMFHNKTPQTKGGIMTTKPLEYWNFSATWCHKVLSVAHKLSKREINTWFLYYLHIIFNPVVAKRTLTYSVCKLMRKRLNSSLCHYKPTYLYSERSAVMF